MGCGSFATSCGTEIGQGKAMDRVPEDMGWVAHCCRSMRNFSVATAGYNAPAGERPLSSCFSVSQGGTGLGRVAVGSLFLSI
jgi:hypothetical protein